MTINNEMNFGKIILALRQFSAQRNWDQFHDPKNLATALSIEASELLEVFLWVNDVQAKDIMKNQVKASQIKDEIADVFNYLVRLSDILGIDLEKEFWNKLEKNAQKYPVIDKPMI